MTTTKNLDLIATMAETVRQAIATTGQQGIPSGHLYSMMMSFGCSYEVYNHLINALKETGKIMEDGFHLLRNV